MKQIKLKKYSIMKHSRNMFSLIYLYSKLGRFGLFLNKYLVEPLFLRKETFYNDWIRQIACFCGGSSIPSGEYKAMTLQLRPIIKYARDLSNSDTSGKPVVWVDWCFSHEILRAFDVLTFVAESPVLAGSFAGTKNSVRIIEEAENEGVPAELCSGSKGAFGAYLLGQSPEPDMIISTSHPCDSTASIYQLISYKTKVPTFVLDSPYWDDEESYNYYEKNYWEMIQFLENNTNQKIDWEKLKHVCEAVNRTNYYLQEITEMGRAVPSPTGIQSLLLSWIGRIVSFGSEDGAMSAKMMYENAKSRLLRKEGYLKEEKIRIIWWDVPVGFYNIHPWLEQEFGAVTVADLIGRVQRSNQVDTSSEEGMVRGLARAQLNTSMARHMRGPFEFVTDELQQVIQEFSGDCIIFSQHVGCTHKLASSKLLKDICKDAGLPALFINIDIFDKRQSSEVQIKKQISEFFKINGLAR